MILSVEAKNAMLQGMADKLNAGDNAVLSVYIGETLAAEISLMNPVQEDITGGVMTFKLPPKAIAIASGIPTSAKLLDPSGSIVADYTAAEILLDKDKIYQNGYVGIELLIMRI